MNTQSIDSKSIGKELPLAGGVLGGFMVGRGVTAAVTKPAPTAQEEKIKKGVQVLLVVGGVAIAALVKGTDATTYAIKGAGAGLAAGSAADLVGGLLSKNQTVQTATAGDSGPKKFMRGALGLGCANCETHNPYASQLNGYKSRRRRLNAPVYNNISFAEPTFEELISRNQSL